MSAPDAGTAAVPGAAEVDALVALAERAARAAGDLIRDGRPDQVEVAATKSSRSDVVTAMDHAAEALLRRHLLTERPDDGLLGEEGGLRTGSSGVTWVVDPIDGTVNYLYGLPAFAVSVAAVSGVPDDPTRWRVLAGCVHDVALGQTWTAGLGRGARLDGCAVEVTRARELAQALVSTGFGYQADRRREQAAVVAGVLPRVRDVRRGGSAAIDLCSVACGRLDAHYERGLQPWDMAAASLVVTEAGGRLGGLHGRPADGRMTVAAAPGIFAALSGLLEELGA